MLCYKSDIKVWFKDRNNFKIKVLEFLYIKLYIKFVLRFKIIGNFYIIF